MRGDKSIIKLEIEVTRFEGGAMILRQHVGSAKTEEGLAIQISSAVPSGALILEFPDNWYVVGPQEVLRAVLSERAKVAS